jgi:hypothetical protein
MLTEQERQQQFMEEYDNLCKRYGLQLAADISPNLVGEMQVGVMPVLRLQAIPHWQPPDVIEAPKNSSPAAQ